MRNLTVKRNKSFVGCLGKMKVYIEDECGDTEICNKKCRLLGELKNGEEKSFEIGEDIAEIFVIADSISKDYCYDSYKLDAGSKDIALEGQNRFNPVLGNPFRFKGQEVDRGEKKIDLKRLITVFVCAIIIGLVFGYCLTTGIYEIVGMQKEDFEIGEMSITLTKAFNRQSAGQDEYSLISKNVDVIVSKNSFTSIGSSEMSATEYARAVLAKIKVLDSEEVSVGGQSAFVFENTESNGAEYTYYLFTFKTSDAYWRVFFVVNSNKLWRYENSIAEWAGSIRFE